MHFKGTVVVHVDMNRLQAQTVKTFLESQGIEAMLSADDAGGELPSFDESRGVEVLVPEDQAEKAKELLADFHAQEGGTGGAPEQGE